MTNIKPPGQARPRAETTVEAARKRLQKLYDRLGDYRAVQVEIGSSNMQYVYSFLKHNVLPSNPAERRILLRWRQRRGKQAAAWTRYPRGAEAAILDLVKPHVGRAQAIHGADLDAALRNRGYELDERKMREAIKQLRRRAYLICAAPGKKGGYFMAASMDEFEAFDREELSAKIADMSETRAAMRRAANRQFGPSVPDGQMELIQ